MCYEAGLPRVIGEYQQLQHTCIAHVHNYLVQYWCIVITWAFSLTTFNYIYFLSLYFCSHMIRSTKLTLEKRLHSSLHHRLSLLIDIKFLKKSILAHDLIRLFMTWIICTHDNQPQNVIKCALLGTSSPRSLVKLVKLVGVSVWVLVLFSV